MGSDELYTFWLCRAFALGSSLLILLNCYKIKLIVGDLYKIHNIQDFIICPLF